MKQKHRDMIPPMCPIPHTHQALLCMIALFFTNCTPIVGGTCKYEEHQGIATVINIKDEHVLAEFTSDQAFTKAQLHHQHALYDLRGASQAQVGDKFPAQLSVIYQGSCTPMQLTVLHQP